MQSCRTSLPRRIPRSFKQVSLKPNQSRTMAFFPRSFYNTEASFTPLFRLLDDFDSYSRQNGSCNANNNAAITKKILPSFQPKFDVREVEDAYELHGELPGVSKENVYIEFSDPQTMLIRGKVERVYSSTTPVDDAASITNGDAASIIDDAASVDSKRNSRQATVADEEENEAQENGKEVEQQQTPEVAEAPVDTAKYWLTERSIGEFARSFNFPSRVEQDTVTASFKDGILSVSVPKAKKHESRRIAIN